MWTWVVFWVRGWRFWTHLDSICVKRRGHTCCIKHVNVSTPQNLPFPCGLPLVILWRTQNMSGWWFQTWMDYFLLLSMGFSFHNWLVVSIMFIFHFIYGIILPIDFHSIIFQDGYCTTISNRPCHPPATSTITSSSLLYGAKQMASHGLQTPFDFHNNSAQQVLFDEQNWTWQSLLCARPGTTLSRKWNTCSVPRGVDLPDPWICHKGQTRTSLSTRWHCCGLGRAQKDASCSYIRKKNVWVKYQTLWDKWWNHHDDGIYPWNIGITLQSGAP